MRDVSSIFDTAPFIQHLGIKVAHQAEGVCDTLTPIRAEHLQQDGYVHAGVLATVADHTAGGAAAKAMDWASSSRVTSSSGRAASARPKSAAAAAKRRATKWA